MKAQEIMTGNPACCTPDDTAQRAAELMEQNDCGCLPVVDSAESRRVLGVVTDRDIATRAVAAGKGPDAKVREVMSAQPSCCGIGDDVEEVAHIMSERQVRRVPVVDADGCCVGMVSQADLARETERSGDVSEHEVARVVECVSKPSSTARAEARVGRIPEAEHRF
ncbi:MAG: CBS domain-containing protein [Gemmatimonadaceae bacterium]|nr:CBS domain-containing protein [Gemmatimonadaceae bacterium]